MPFLSVNTADDFDAQVLKAAGPVMAGFTAPWCPHCKVLAPKMQQMAAALPALAICPINIDALPELAERYKVQTIPQLIFFKDGKEAARLIAEGKSEAEILAFVQTELQALS